jgi:hypothetical protein
MTYPPVTQLETRALQAEAQARLADERRAARVLPAKPGGTAGAGGSRRRHRLPLSAC